MINDSNDGCLLSFFFHLSHSLALRNGEHIKVCLQVLGRITAFVKKKKKLPRALTCQVWDLKNRKPKRGNSNLQNYLWDNYLSHVFEKSGENECNICSHCCR